MSGTSIDSIDAVITDLTEKKPVVVFQQSFEIPKDLRLETLKLINEGKTKEDVVTSCYWILTALTMVSPNAAEGLPDLVQSYA